MTDLLREKFNRKEQCMGLYISIADPMTVEMAAQAGFDFIRIDMEHTLFSLGEIRELVRTANLHHLPAFIRVPDVSMASALLDAGADGLVVPQIDSREAAIRAINEVKYGPVGLRGMAGSQRSTGYGDKKLTDFIGEANKNVMLCIQIESKEGVEHIDEILALEGIDMVSTGKHDLSQSYGHPGQNAHPEILAAEEYIIAKTLEYGKQPVLLVSSAKRRDALLEKGVRGFMLDRDSALLYRGMKQCIETYKLV